MKTDYTFVLARVLGPLLAIAGLMLITQSARMHAALTGFLLDEALLMFAGFVTLALGLMLVAFHQRWDSVTPSIISILGWLLTLRGAALLLAPDLVRRAAGFVDAQPNILPIAGCVLALIGVWLTYAGYVAGTLRVDTSQR
ncbi:MAG: hypothetical protein R3C25_07350 [Hyphomonadaceae bacterium]